MTNTGHTGWLENRVNNGQAPWGGDAGEQDAEKAAVVFVSTADGMGELFAPVHTSLQQEGECSSGIII